MFNLLWLFGGKKLLLCLIIYKGYVNIFLYIDMFVAMTIILFLYFGGLTYYYIMVLPAFTSFKTSW